MFDGPIETVKYIWVNIWFMLDLILSQNYRNTLSLPTINRGVQKRSSCALPIASSQCQRRCSSDGRIKKYRSGCDFPLFEQFYTKQVRGIFTIICTVQINAVCFPSFHNDCNPACKAPDGRENVSNKKWFTSKYILNSLSICVMWFVKKRVFY